MSASVESVLSHDLDGDFDISNIEDVPDIESAITFGHLCDAYEQAGVKLPTAIWKAGHYGASSINISIKRESTPILAAINEAAKLLRNNPGSALVQSPVELPDFIQAYHPARILGRLINTSAEHQEGDSDIPPFERRINAIGTCSKAEGTFSQAIWKLQDIADKNPALNTADSAVPSQIIVGSDGPVFFRKGVGNASSLALREVVVQGVTYPAGFIMNVLLDTDGSQNTYWSLGADKPGELVSARHIAGVGPSRPSSFTFDPVLRDQLYNSLKTDDVEDLDEDLYGSFEEWSDIERTMPIKGIAAVAHRIQQASRHIH